MVKDFPSSTYVNGQYQRQKNIRELTPHCFKFVLFALSKREKYINVQLRINPIALIISCREFILLLILVCRRNNDKRQSYIISPAILYPQYLSLEKLYNEDTLSKYMAK